jgi:hypothetical protein
VGGAVALLLGNAAAASVRWWTLRRLLQETPRHPQAEAA